MERKGVVWKGLCSKGVPFRALHRRAGRNSQKIAKKECLITDCTEGLLETSVLTVWFGEARVGMDWRGVERSGIEGNGCNS